MQESALGKDINAELVHLGKTYYFLLENPPEVAV